jgi:ribonuclease I
MSRMKLVAVVLLFSLLGLTLVSKCHSRRSFSKIRASASTCSGGSHGTAGEFDLYVLSQSWSPQYCSSYADYPGCQEPTDWQQTNLTLHGLWPQYSAKEDGYCQSRHGRERTAGFSLQLSS